MKNIKKPLHWSGFFNLVTAEGWISQQSSAFSENHYFIWITSPCLVIPKPACRRQGIRFENTSNKKTLKQAWRFFLLNYLFVATAGFKSVAFQA